MTPIGIALVSFVFTNLDDLLILFVLFSTSRIPPQSIIIGQYLGISLIVMLSWISGFLGTLFFSKSWLAFLGVFPIILGIKKLYDLCKGKKGEPLVSSAFGGFQSRIRTQTLLVTVITLANGGDNVAVYTSLFANSNRRDALILVVVYFCMTSLWCLIAYTLATHEKLRIHLERYGNPSLPWVMIGLGIYTLV